MRDNTKTWRKTARTAIVFMLVYFMVWGGVPAPALAEMAEEAIEAASYGELTEESRVIVSDPSAEDDSDELYAGYVQHMLDEALPNGSGESAAVDKRTAIGIQSAKQGLRGSNLYIYNEIRAMAEQVAAGKRTSTAVTIECSSLPEKFRPTKPWTAGDLGISALSNGVIDAAFTKMGIDYDLIFDALVADCPYELYWFDKTKEGMEVFAGYSTGTYGGEDVVSFVNGFVKFNLYVIPKYSTTNETKTTEVRSDLVSSVNAAITTAQGIVNDPDKAGLTVLERLAAYKDAVCELVTYDSNAAGGHADDGNPWQLVSVFDGDPDTNVVCEGYSKAFKYLCDMTWPDRTDVECLIVTGTMEGGDHMWNIVHMDDGRNYLVDVTNCDEGTVDAPDKLFMAFEPTGSYDTSYTFALGNGSSVEYVYGQNEQRIYGAEGLTISDQKYASPGEFTEVPVPTAASLVYNGLEQTGVAAGTGYTLSGDTAKTDAGEYTATATLANGYKWSDGTTMRKTITWSIARKSVTVTADNKTKIVGEADPELTATVSGTVGNDAVVYTLSRAAGEEIGNYDITPAGDAVQGNYAVTFVAGKFTITSDVVSGTWGTCSWEITSDGVLTVGPGTGESQDGKDASPWTAYKDRITSVVFANDADKMIILPANSSCLFSSMDKVTSMNLSGADTTNATDMSSMFSGCSSLVSIDLSGFDTGNSTTMNHMFSDCSSLEALNVSGFDTSRVQDMGYMFYSCSSLKSIDVSEWDTRRVNNILGMFMDCSSLEMLNLSDWDMSSVVIVSDSFLDSAGIDHIYASFAGCSSLKELYVPHWDISARDLNYLFFGCSSLRVLDLSSWERDGRHGQLVCNEMFYECTSLEELDISGFNCFIEGSLFHNCRSLKVFKLGSWHTEADGYQCGDIIPDATASNGKWWSVNEQAWYTKDEILANRAGVADTYANYELVQRTDISAAVVATESESYAYAGASQQPVPTVTLDGVQLTAGTDFTCSYANNRNVGTATVTVTGIGACEGTATGTFEITKAPLTVRAKNHAINYGDAPGNDGVVYESLLGSDTAASLGGSLQYACNYTQYGDVGSAYTITPSGLTSDNYDITFAPGTLTVGPKPVELTWSNTSFTYDASSHVPTVAVGGLVNGDTVTATVGGAQTNAGTYTATATSVSNSNYCVPEGNTCGFTIAKASINPTVTLEGWIYGEDAKTPVVAGNPGNGAVTFAYAPFGSSPLEYRDEVPTAAGRYSVRATVAETDNYLQGAAFADFEIEKAASSVTSAPEANAPTYTGGPQALVTAGAASGGTMLYSTDNSTWSGDVPTATDADAYSVWYKVEGDANHTDVASTDPIAVTIAKASNSLSVGTGPTIGMGDTFELSTLVSGADGSVSYAITTALAGCSVGETTGTFTAGATDGTCVVTITAAGDANHESATKTLTVTIRPSIADATISFQDPQDSSVDYDGNAHMPAITVVHNGATLTPNDYDVEYLDNTNAGTATVRVTGKGGYAGTKDKTFTINKLAATVKAKDSGKAYGTDDPAFSADVTGTINGDELAYAISREAGEGLGTYAITPSGAADQGNYAVSYENGEFTIVQASISGARATFARQTYAGNALSPKPSSLVANGNALVENTDYEITGYANNTDAGVATATIQGRGGYKDAVQVKFAIDPAPVSSVSLGASSYTYDGKAKTPGASVRAGSLTVPASSYSVSYANNVNAGTATVTVTGRGNFTGTKKATFRISPAQITSVSVSPASYDYDGSAKRPGVTVRAGSATVPAGGYDVSYANNVNPGTATATVTGKGNYTGRKAASFAIRGTPAAHVAYRTHVQSFGWQDYVRDGAMSGTSGKAKRLEGINIKLEGAAYPGSIEYRTHVQTYGWQSYRRDGAMSGTSGQAKRLEAIQIRLTGQMAQRYDVWYRVHAQTYGWLGWAKNDSPAGTAGLAKRLEGIEIRVLPKGSAAPGQAFGAFVSQTGASPAQSDQGHQVGYRTHVQSFGWQGLVYDGQMSGTQGLAKRLEGIEISLPAGAFPCSGGIEYRTHVQKIGWQDYRANGAMSGTSGRALRLEAIQIRLTGQMAQRYDVWYRVHAQTFGWMGWAKNDQQSGTAGFAKRLEGIQILVLPKGSPAPGTTANAFRKK